MTKFSIKSLLTAVALSAAVLSSAFADTNLKVGVTAGPHAKIFDFVKEQAKKQGINVTVVEFTDYIVPNQALAAGELDANSFQHQPYLDNQVKDRGYKIESVGTTVIYPMGFYSKKLKSISELPDGAQVAIQNDPTNGGRALLLLQEKGYIKLKEGTGFKPSITDVIDNPKQLKFIELDAAQLPRSLDDVTLAAINTNFALEAKLDPTKDALIIETTKSPYANVIAVQSSRKAEPWVAQLVKIYQSPEVKQFIETTFKGSVVSAF